MANTITKRINEIPQLLDFVFKKVSVTQILEKPSDLIRETETAGTIKVAKRVLSGYGDYARENAGSGYPSGDVSLTWQSHSIQNDRAIELKVDKLDNDETGDNAFTSIASLGGQLVREHQVPEVDATRFATMAGTANILTTTAAVLSAATVKAAVDAAIEAMDEEEVPEEGRVLFMSTSVYNFMKNSSFFTYDLDSRAGNNQGIENRVAVYDGMPVIKVPQSRFYTAIDLNDGATTYGYEKAAGGLDINFMIVYNNGVLPIKTYDSMKYFAPDINQRGDSHLVQSRFYHGLLELDNKVTSIYLHKSTT